MEVWGPAAAVEAGREAVGSVEAVEAAEEMVEVMMARD